MFENVFKIVTYFQFKNSLPHAIINKDLRYEQIKYVKILNITNLRKIFTAIALGIFQKVKP